MKKIFQVLKNFFKKVGIMLEDFYQSGGRENPFNENP